MNPYPGSRGVMMKLMRREEKEIEEILNRRNRT